MIFAKKSFYIPVTKNVDGLQSESESESEQEGRKLLVQTWNELQYIVTRV